MKYQLNLLIVLLLLGITTKGFTQLDDPNNGGKTKGNLIGTIETPAKEVKKPKSLTFKDDNGFKTAYKKQQKELKQKQKEQSLETKGIITPQIIAEQNFKKNVEGKFANFPMIDMDLGSFHTKSEFLYISSYDFGRFDGDRVQIAINGEIYKHNFLLTSQIKTVKIRLETGINRIEVTAINEGEFSPNTGYFAFFDDNKYIIKKGEWMLAKGAKVIAIVVKDEK